MDRRIIHKMAIKPTKRKLVCTVKNIEPDPLHPGRQIISLELDDGQSDGPYIRAFSLIPPEIPLSLEKFALDLAKRDLSRPTDPLHYIKEAQANSEQFVINLADNS